MPKLNIQISEIALVENLSFKPTKGFASPHFQTIFPLLFRKGGKEPHCVPYRIDLDDGDALLCKVSKPPKWMPHQKTILMLHGLGGSESSAYMIRMSRKFYEAGFKTVRVNLRGCGEGSHLAKRPYNGGTSGDVLQVIQTLKKECPESPIILIGYSLGGNITLKLMGELGNKASSFIEMAIAICAPINLSQTMKLLSKKSNYLYHQYYVKGLRKMGARWIGDKSIKTIMDFDNIVTGPHWGYSGAEDYYQNCSSLFFLSQIQQNCHLIFAADDPFVDYTDALKVQLSPAVKIGLSAQGGHMGFFGWAGNEHHYDWLDSHLLNLLA